MKSKHKVKHEEIRAEVTTPPPQTTEASHQKTWAGYWIPAIGLVLMGIVFIGMDRASIEHPWMKASFLLDSVVRTSDPLVKNQLLDETGKILSHHTKIHPYHARIWAIYGRHFALKENWDSCIIAEKKAIELGRDAPVNTVEDMAQLFMGMALFNKVQPLFGQQEEALKIINAAEVPGYNNPPIHKLKGFVYFSNNDFENGKKHTLMYLEKNPKDFDALQALAINCSKQGLKSEAVNYIQQALAINPRADNLRILLQQNTP